MAERIPQSVAYLVVFRAYLAADGKTPATGKTISVTISKAGGAFGNPAVGALNATEMASGFYKFTLGAADLDTLGPLAWRGAQADINDAGDVLSVTNEIADLPTVAELTAALAAADDAILTAIAALNDLSGDDAADAYLDRADAIDGYTPREIYRGIAAALLGKVSGVVAQTPVFRDVADTKDRIATATNGDGRQTVVLDLD